MGFSQASVVFLTFLVALVLVIVIKRNRNLQPDVVVYSIGHKEFEEKEIDETEEALLHVSQVMQRAKGNGDLTVVNVEFPKIGQDLIVMFIKVLNYNSQVSNAQLITQEKEDSNFWILVSEGSIGTDNVTVEINSYVDIDADVEFYGFKKENDS